MKSKNFGKTFTAITLFFALCCFITTGLWAAKKVELYSPIAKNYMNQLNAMEKTGNTTLGPVMNLTQDESFQLIRLRTDFNRVTHYRQQQLYKGIPVWGMSTVVSVNAKGQVVRVHGNLVRDLESDIKNIPSKLDPLGALEQKKSDHTKNDKNATWNFRNEEYGTFIYVHKNGKAYVAYVVSFFADNENGNPSRMVYFIDAKNGRTLHSFNNLQHADGTGPGGNLKVGQYEYGTDYPAFGVTANGSTCTMNTTDVKTVNLNHGTSGTTAFSYTCYRNTVKEINGAYSPLNDAQYFGQIVFDLYNTWYGVPPLPFQLTLRCHYSTNYENAFWDGSTMTFGDGYSTFYPLVALDVVAHEVSHGFTDYNSDLIYSGQSGGINEAFSDMAGEAAEYFMRGDNDFWIGYDIFKAPNGALRYMDDPPADGISIDHVDDYYSGMDVHYSSGIYNKVFYLVATSPGWDTHMAFDIFVKANQDYWTPSTNFQQGADGVIDATADYGYSCADVAAAFAVVGITVECPGPPVAEFSGTPLTGGFPLTVTFTDLSTNNPTSWSWDFGDTGTSAAQNPTHVYNLAGTYTVTLIATNANGSGTETKVNYITVTAPQPPVADFVASTTNPYTGQTVNFTDLTTNSPTSWSWTFEGGTPATSTAQNPSVVYNTAGTYTVTLTASNIAGSDDEIKTGYITVTDEPLVYCTSRSNNYNYEYIGNVTVGNLDNTSGGSYYTDFTSLTAYVNSDDTVSVSLTPVFPSSTYTEYWKIWIDYNIDGDFTDAGEEVFSAVSSTTVTGSFTVPATASGTTRMRVSMKWSAAPTSCETFTYGEVEDYSINITPIVVYPPVADFTASDTDINEGDSVTFTDTSTNNPTSWSWSFPGGTPSSSTAQNPTVTYNTEGTYDVTLTATNSAGSDPETKTGFITVSEVTGGITFETGTVGSMGNSWQTVNLNNSYTSPVVVCSSDLGGTGLPAVVRVNNVSSNSFDVMVQNPSGTALSGYTVHYIVVEEGVYTSAVDGVTMEAAIVNSTATAQNNSWVMEARSYQNSYTNPVVVGQVMSYNDPDWSVFWACGTARSSPPAASTLYAGKEVAEDTDTTRANETIGMIIIEQGSGAIGTIPYTAAVGSDTIRGEDNTSTGYTYSFSTVNNASTAIVSMAGMDGGNGGWPVMYGSNPLTDTSLVLVVDEDQIGDSERAHTTEQVAYIVFGQ